jgi:HSP20 family protein
MDIRPSNDDGASAFDRLFEEMRRSMFGADGRPGTGAALRTERTDDAFVVTADLPGFAAEDVDLLLEDDVLVLRADARTDETTDDTVRATRRSVSERLRVPAGVDEADAEATFRNGVLQVTLPLAADAETGRRIDIN